MSKDLKQQFVSNLFNARNRVRFAMDDMFKPLDITDATWRTLFFLRQEGNGLQQKELAKTMGIESPSLVRLLDNLAKKSLIERRTDPNDRRSNTLYLTKKSEALFEQLDVLSKQARESVLKDVSNEDIKTCIRVFEKVLSAQPNE